MGSFELDERKSFQICIIVARSTGCSRRFGSPKISPISDADTRPGPVTPKIKSKIQGYEMSSSV